MIRIFLILGILTMGVVLSFQWLILAPMSAKKEIVPRVHETPARSPTGKTED